MPRGDAGTTGGRSAEDLRLLSDAEGEAGMRRNERRYRSLLEATSGTVVWLADARGRLVSDIPEWRRFTGQSREELLGSGWQQAIHPDDRERVAAAWAAAVEAGAPYDAEYRISNAEGDVRHYAARAVPIPDADGVVREWIGFCIDRTEHVRAREVEEALQAALDSERRILEQVVAQAPTAVAVLWGPEHRIRFFNERYLELAPPGRVAPGRSLAEAFPEALPLIPIVDRARAGEALRSESIRVPFDDERSFEGFRYYDVSYTPLLDGDDPGGVLIVATETTDAVRRRHDLERRLDEHRRRAEELQHALLPEVVSELPGLEVAVRYLPGTAGVSVGGDWYDVVPLDAHRVALVIGDVGGRGIAAARTMGQLRSALRAYLFQDLSPAAILAELAGFCARLDLADLVTAGVGVLDLREGALTYANAGHLPPLVWRPGAEAELPRVHRGPPIGVPDPAYEQVVIPLPPGSFVALFTDGLVERRRQSLGDSLESLRARAALLRTDPAARCEELLAIALGQGPLDDDVALLVCRTSALAPPAGPDGTGGDEAGAPVVPVAAR